MGFGSCRRGRSCSSSGAVVGGCFWLYFFACIMYVMTRYYGNGFVFFGLGLETIWEGSGLMLFFHCHYRGL
jgi:hypothetical protein